MKKDIESILSNMTLEEKVAQILQIPANISPDIIKRFRDMGTLGSFLHVLGKDTEGYIAPSRETEKKIPPIFGIDAIHGHALLKEATIFPTQLAVACSFNEELVQAMGEATAKEVAADGLDWVFSPVLCLGRDLRWGRVDETFGEDAYLASRLGSAIIRGYQTNDMVAACAKHYLGYGEATGGRDSYDTEITERKAREVFLKPFKAAVDAGCMTFMTAYGSIDGKPLTASHRYLTEILKEEYGFEGFVVTDWDNFGTLHRGQRAAETMEEACAEGLLAGNDMCMTTDCFYEATIKAVQQGIVSEEVLDNAVRRVLRVKKRMGVLDGGRKRPDRSVIGCKEHAELNYKLTLESSVLLKNDGILPLKSCKKIAVIGPNADNIHAQYGDWTYFSHPCYNPNATPKESAYSMLRGFREVYAGSEVSYAMGCSVKGTEEQAISDAMMEEALTLAKEADVVVIVIGDGYCLNGEGCDLAQPVFQGRQIELVKRIAALGKKVIAVLVNGKPLVLTEIEGCCNAIVESFNSGDFGGLAVAKLVKGEENFSGKLPISFPRLVGAEPYYYNQYDYWHGGSYADAREGHVLYPFGFGLSYSDCKIEKLSIDKETAVRGEKVSLRVELSNQSKVDGKQTVQLYFKDKYCKMLTPIRQLIDFKKVDVPAGAQVAVQFTVDTEDLGYYDEKCNYCVDEGEFILYVSLDGVRFEEVSLWIIFGRVAECK